MGSYDKSKETLINIQQKMELCTAECEGIDKPVMLESIKFYE